MSILNNTTLFKKSDLGNFGIVKYFFPRTMATRIEDYYKDDEDSYKKRILKMGKMKTVEKTRKMKKVKTRKRDNFNPGEPTGSHMTPCE